MIIPNTTFLEIYDTVVTTFNQQYEEKYKEPPNLMQTFGLKGHDTDRWTLKDAIYNAKQAKTFLATEAAKTIRGSEKVFNAKYLYNKARELKSNRSTSTTIRLTYPYNRFIFLYLGYDHYDDFQLKRGKTATFYEAYYYSYKYHKVLSFEFSVNYDVKPSYPGVQYQDFSVKEWGYHDSHEERIYEGYAYILEGKLQLIMWNKSDGDRLRIMLESGDNPKENKTMRGSILAVSSSPGRPLSNAEIVAVKRDDSTVDKRDILRIRRYLFMHRYNFRIKTQSINLKRMDAKGDGVDVMRHYVGVWRSYRYDDSYENILTSMIWVSDDYRIVCLNSNYDQDNLNEQVCLPDITIDAELNTRTICMDCFPKEGAKIISSIMLNLPSANQKDHIAGTILLVGQDGGFPSMKALVLFRDTDLEEQLQDRREEIRMGFLKSELLSSFGRPPEHVLKALKEVEMANRFPG